MKQTENLFTDERLRTGEIESYHSANNGCGICSKFRRMFELGNSDGKTQRNLKSRHMLMLSVGGAIGTGIFLSSGQSVSIAGPGSGLIAFLLSGMFIVSIMIMLGEICAAIPISGAYGSFATRFVSKPLGFALGVTYYIQWALNIPAGITACAIIIQFWLPNLHTWIWALVFALPLFMLQLINVRAYGEIEYWATLLKIILVILFVMVGFLYDWGAVSIAKVPAPHLSYWQNGQAFYGGFAAFSQALVYSFFSYSGAELVSLTSAEASNPKETIPRAIRLTYIRVLVFNILTVLAVGLCIRRDDPRLMNAASQSVTQSPFILVFQDAGFPRAVIHLINAVILIAILSTLNSGYYASTRIMVTMGRVGVFPKVCGKVNRNGIPVVAVIITLLLSCLAFLTTIWGAGVVFSWLQNLISITGIITMSCTGLINVRFRRSLKAYNLSLKDLPFKQPLYPFLPILSVTYGLFIFCIQGYANAKNTDHVWKNLLATYLGVVLFLVCYFGYWLKERGSFYIRAENCELLPGSIWDSDASKDFNELKDFDERKDFNELKEFNGPNQSNYCIDSDKSFTYRVRKNLKKFVNNI